MYFLNVPPISLLDDRDPPSKILKEPRGLYASKVADLMTSWQTIPRWPAESQVSLFRFCHRAAAMDFRQARPLCHRGRIVAAGTFFSVTCH